MRAGVRSPVAEGHSHDIHDVVEEAMYEPSDATHDVVEWQWPMLGFPELRLHLDGCLILLG